MSTVANLRERLGPQHFRDFPSHDNLLRQYGPLIAEIVDAYLAAIAEPVEALDATGWLEDMVIPVEKPGTYRLVAPPEERHTCDGDCWGDHI